MENPAQVVAARVFRGSTVTLTPCVRILRGIDIASRSGAQFKLVMKFIYQAGSTILTQESTQDVARTTPVLTFDGMTALIRGASVALSQEPDAGTQIVASVKIMINDASGTPVELSEAATATFIA